MSTYQNRDGESRYIWETAEVFTSNPLQLKRLRAAKRSYSGESTTNDPKEQSARFGLTETLVLIGKWSKPFQEDLVVGTRGHTQVDLEENIKENSENETKGWQCVRISLLTHFLDLNTPNRSKLYVSMKKPNDNFGSVRRDVRRHPSTKKLIKTLESAQQSGVEKTESFTLEGCLLHTHPNLTKTDVRDWNIYSATKQSTTTQDLHRIGNDAMTGSVDSANFVLGKIIGEISLDVEIRICTPEGGPDSDDTATDSNSDMSDSVDEEYYHVE